MEDSGRVTIVRDAPAVVHTKPCMMCGERGEVTVPSAARYLAWRKGALIQTVLGDLGPDVREQLMSGIHPECFAELTAGMEEGDEDRG